MLFRAPALTPINVGSNYDVSILELARAVASALNSNIEVEVAKSAISGALPARYVPSVARAKDMLGLSQTIGLDDCIRRTTAWYRHRLGLGPSELI
jgi:nucleoside-diphosphate-sugar epimerase